MRCLRVAPWSRAFSAVAALGFAASSGVASASAASVDSQAESPCPKDAASRLTVTPTGIIWGETVATVCAAGGSNPPHDAPIGASVILESGTGDKNRLYVSVGVLGVDRNEAAMPSSYAALPAAWAAQPDRVVLRISALPNDDKGVFELRIGQRVGDGSTCRWYRSTELVGADALWLRPRRDAVAAAPDKASSCDERPPDGTFRPVGPGDPPFWPGG